MVPGSMLFHFFSSVELELLSLDHVVRAGSLDIFRLVSRVCLESYWIVENKRWRDRCKI